jgi:uncharacterized protein
VEHTGYEPDRLIVDEQKKGPFARWRHEHRFEPLDGGRTALEDVVEWEPPLGSLGRAFSRSFVESALRRAFAFRARRLAGDLELHGRYRGDPLTVAVSGSTGLIGEALVGFLRTGGHRVIRMTRSGETRTGAKVRSGSAAVPMPRVPAVVPVGAQPAPSSRPPARIPA